MNVSTPNKPEGFAGLWSQIGSQLAAQPLVAVGLACVALVLVLSLLRSLHREHPALAGFLVFLVFGLVLVLAAGLSVFIALLNALEERRYDLAVMRMLGAGRGRLMGLMLLEGAALSLAGGLAGIAGMGEVAGLKGVAVLAEQMENVIRRGGHERTDPTRGPKCRQSEQ